VIPVVVGPRVMANGDITINTNRFPESFHSGVAACVLAALLGLCLPPAVHASSSVAEPSAHMVAPATVLMRRATDRLFADIATHREVLGDPQKRRALVKRHVAEHVDFYGIARRVLGKHWRRASSAQRERFRVELKAIIFTAFADLLITEEASLEFGTPRDKSNQKRVSIPSKFRTSNRMPMDVRFRLENSTDGWKLYDLVIEGVSLVTTYRAAIDAEIRSKGLVELINSLAHKNAKFAPKGS
jgi:phospholipid transport system substrate-binding protein